MTVIWFQMWDDTYGLLIDGKTAIGEPCSKGCPNKAIKSQMKSLACGIRSCEVPHFATFQSAAVCSAAQLSSLGGKHWFCVNFVMWGRKIMQCLFMSIGPSSSSMPSEEQQFRLPQKAYGLMSSNTNLHMPSNVSVLRQTLQSERTPL